MVYTIVKGNEQKKFELVNKHGVWALHFRRRLKKPGHFELILHGTPAAQPQNESATQYEKPLTLKVRLEVTE